jgi:hypothetical protein
MPYAEKPVSAGAPSGGAGAPSGGTEAPSTGVRHRRSHMLLYPPTRVATQRTEQTEQSDLFSTLPTEVMSLIIGNLSLMETGRLGLLNSIARNNVRNPQIRETYALDRRIANVIRIQESNIIMRAILNALHPRNLLAFAANRLRGPLPRPQHYAPRSTDEAEAMQSAPFLRRARQEAGVLAKTMRIAPLINKAFELVGMISGLTMLGAMFTALINNDDTHIQTAKVLGMTSIFCGIITAGLYALLDLSNQILEPYPEHQARVADEGRLPWQREF